MTRPTATPSIALQELLIDETNLAVTLFVLHGTHKDGDHLEHSVMPCSHVQAAALKLHNGSLVLSGSALGIAIYTRLLMQLLQTAWTSVQGVLCTG